MTWLSTTAVSVIVFYKLHNLIIVLIIIKYGGTKRDFQLING